MMWLIVAVAAAVVVAFAVLYNGLVSMRQLTKNAWADVDVYLKRRAELIPNLVNAVKGYAGYEKATLEALADARSRALTAPGPGPERAQAEASVTSGVAKVVAIAEAYPDLKAADNFLNLQRELSETERHIASARQYYNACVRDYNIKIEAFPSSIVAGAMGLRHIEFFETETAQERLAPSVSGIGERR
jgi:LemA protein